jgi:hypothetical protein
MSTNSVHDETEDINTVISSLSSTTSSWIPRPQEDSVPTPALAPSTRTAQVTTTTAAAAMTTTATPAFGLKAVYARNEDAAAAGAAAAARENSDHSRQMTMTSTTIPLGTTTTSVLTNPGPSLSLTQMSYLSEQSDASSSVVVEPTTLFRQESTPGAISVPGVDGSVDNEQHDNLLEEEAEENGGYDAVHGSRSMGGLKQHAGQSPAAQFSTAAVCSSPSPREDEEAPIMAELVSASSIDQEEVERRLAERLEAQMEERLKQEVDRRISQERQKHAIGEIVVKEDQHQNQPRESSRHNLTTSAGAAATADDRVENFKICGIRRTCWGMILCVILMFIAAGAITAILWVFRDNLRHNTNDSGDGAVSTIAPTAPSFPATEEPSVAPTRPMVAVRWDYLLETIGPAIVGENNDPIEYFANATTPQYDALMWMAAMDLDTDIFVTPTQILIERYVLAVLYYSTGGPTDWIEPLNFLGSDSVCNWSTAGENTDPSKVKGIGCSNGRLVTDILIPENGLQGDLPWELSLLEYLIQMDFDLNGLSGTIPTEFGELERLKNMWFKSNALTGLLPVEFVNMTSLESIDFSGNALSSMLPYEWGFYLSNLVFVSFSSNNIVGTLPAEWKGLTSLRVLDMEGNQLDGNLPEEYGMLTELSSLYLESNSFQGTLPTEYGELTNLRNFFVYDNYLTGNIPTEYSSLSELDFFWFNANDLTGSVDQVFCDTVLTTFSVLNLRADCFSDDPGVEPQINCTCCTVCCNSTGTGCV